MSPRSEPGPAQESDATSGSPSGSSRGCYIAACVVAVALFVAIGIPNLMANKIVSNEGHTIAALREYVRAQEEFRKKDRYGKGKRVYANPVDGAGFPDLFEIGGPNSGGTKLELIDESMALASSQRGQAWRGYYFLDITGMPSGPFDYTSQHGLAAYPRPSSRSGRYCFIVDEYGYIFQRDITHIPGYDHDRLRRGEVPEALRTYPSRAEFKNWIPVDALSE